MSKIKSWTNGVSMQTKICVVDEDGREVPLEVRGFALDLDADRDFPLRMGDVRRPWLRLLPCVIGSEVEIEVPVDGAIATKLRERFSDAGEVWRHKVMQAKKAALRWVAEQKVAPAELMSEDVMEGIVDVAIQELLR